MLTSKAEHTPSIAENMQRRFCGLCGGGPAPTHHQGDGVCAQPAGEDLVQLALPQEGLDDENDGPRLGVLVQQPAHLPGGGALSDVRGGGLLPTPSAGHE